MAAETLYREGALTVQEICDQLNISKPTLYRYLEHRRVQTGSRQRTDTGAAPRG
jgi:predicted transcriptional regulator YheO